MRDSTFWLAFACWSTGGSVRDLLVKQRRQLVNMIRGLMVEFGINIPQGVVRALGLARQIAAKEAEPDLPAMAKQILGLLCGQVIDAHARLQEIDRAIIALQRTDELARRLTTSLPAFQTA
ncbi:hypothetical protein DFR52_10160 [Hoeflea marina]|uniref:Uncharacterized protein n=1 Tax=Hoeflea marina TaxID=274592 RepID=A0A317PVC8_9HYPH|nr:hypothetical protein [Hoeflea marina]PWW03380.1 hypothetical protein DFR52_10160 [Hoeflea marina]